MKSTKSRLRTMFSGYVGFAIFGMLVFGPVGTFNYWRGWVFLAVIAISSWIMSLYFMRVNPAVLERRVPVAESRKYQKTVMSGIYLLAAATVAVSSLDYRLGWSAVPVAVSLVGDVLVAAGIWAMGVVLAQNNHASVTIQVETGQELVSTGLYGLVRHPMYACNAFFLVGIPLALGSYWGLIFAVPCLSLFAVRIHDEEKMLQGELAGYHEYMQQVRYRLVPYVW